MSLTNTTQRKWEKKLRNAKTEEQKQKAQSILRGIRLNSMAKHMAPKHMAPKKDVLMTDDQLIQQAIKENKVIKENKAIKDNKDDMKTTSESRLSLEKDRKRRAIMLEKKKRDEERENKKADEMYQYALLTRDRLVHSKRVANHVKYAEKYANHSNIRDRMNFLYKGKTVRVDKEYAKFIKNSCDNIENTIQLIMESKELSYVEARVMVYSQIVNLSNVEEPVEEDKVEEPVEEDKVEELTEVEWNKIVEEHPELCM